ncbi:MAG: hypothetical protein ACXVNR_08040 [Bacteroidia bacterium]
MKKLVYAGKVLTIASLVVLTGCKKDKKEAFPSKPNGNGNTSDYVFKTPTIPSLYADGILTAVQMHSYRIQTVSPIEQDFEYGMAKFTNATGNFSSLANADSVRVNGANLVMGSDNSYLSDISTPNLSFSGVISWMVKGAPFSGATSTYTNTSNPYYKYFSISSGNYWNDAWMPVFPKDTTDLRPKVYLTHADSVANPPRYQQFLDSLTLFRTDSTWNETPYASLPIKNSIMNADSVYVIWDDAVSFHAQRVVPATDSLFYIKPSYFNRKWTNGATSLTQTNFTMQINAIKYTSATLSGKLFYFLKMGSYMRYWKSI